ncbi:MAG: T9SS type A sorting domain-containing protein [Flavipsychrobacter sp.]
MKKIILTLSVLFGALTASYAQSYIWGTVAPNSGQGNILDMKVWLIKKCQVGNSYTLTAIDSADIADSIHAFSFPNPQIGTNCQLLVKAAFKTNSPHYNNYLPTYYSGSTSGVGSLLWSGAAPVTAATQSNPTYWNFTMVQGTNPGGPGFVGGSVLQGANKGTAAGDPLEGRTMLLTDMKDNAVAFTTTDATGKFSFSSLANGVYKLFGDQWGKDNPALTITVDANNQNINNIVFEETSTKFSGRFVWATNVTNVNSNLSNLTVYPNPMKGEVKVAGLQNIAGDKLVTITNVSGAVVYTNTFSEGANVVLSTSDMASGLYLMQVKTTEGTATFKLTK